jgi:MFS family permease
VLRGVGHAFGGYAMSRRDLRLLFAAVFLSFLGSSMTFPLRMLYAQRHHATPAQLGLMAAAFLLAPLLSQLPMGWLVDRWGRVPVLLVGLVGHTIISLLYIWLYAPDQLIVLRFLEGVTVSAFQPAIGAYIADVTPQEHRSEAYGALGATLNAGMLIGPLIGGVVGQYFGFTAAFIVNCIVEGAAIPLVLGHVHEPVVHESHITGSRSGWRHLFTGPLTAVYATYLCMQAAMGMLSALWAIWVHDLGGSYAFIGITFSVFALPQIFFGARAGKLADRLGRAPFLLASGILAGLIYVSYGFMTSLILITIFGVMEGLVIVFQQPVVQGFLADASPPDARGRAQGLSGALGAIGGSLMAFISLPLYHHARPAPFIVAGVITVIGGVVSFSGSLVFQRRRKERALAAIEETKTA